MRCRQTLLEAFEGRKLEVYGRPRGDPLSHWSVLDPDRQREVLEGWKYDPQLRPLGEVYLPDYGNMPVRVHRRDPRAVSDGPEPLKAPKGRPGAKARYDWDAFAREIVRLAQTPDGLPEPQAELEKHMADWFNETYGTIPAESTIRKRLVKVLPVKYRETD